MSSASCWTKKDIFMVIAEKINGIDVNYRRAVILGFITCLVSYGFQLTHVVMSPDMFKEVVTGDSYSISFSGRWFMAFLRNVLLSDYRIVPTFNLLITIILFISTSLLIVKIWRISRPLYVYIIISLITANTYTCHILRWENAHVEASITTFIAVLSLYFSGKGIKMFFPALVLMTCAHGGYQTGVAFSCVALFAGFALWVLQDGNLKNLNRYLRTKIIPAILVFLGGFILHKIVLNILMRFLNLQEGMRLANTQIPTTIGEFISNLNMVLNSISSIFTHQVLYFTFQIGLIYKLFFILAVISLIVFYLNDKSLGRFVLIVLFVLVAFLSLLSTYLPTIAVGYGWLSNRILYPIAVFHSLIAMLVISSKTLLLRNLAVMLSFCLIFLFSWHNNMYAYRSFVQDRADFELAGRIISKIENFEGYKEVAGTSLKIARIGTQNIATPGYRFTATPNIKVRKEGAFSQEWSADGIFRYLHFPHESVLNLNLQDQILSNKMAETILKMEEWPSPDCVAIVDGIAILMLDKSKIPNKVLSMLYDKNNLNDEYIIHPGSSHLKPNAQIIAYSPDGNFVASGIDPSIAFNIPDPKKNLMYIIKVDLQVPKRTIAQLFYKSGTNSNFSENQSLRQIATIDRNEYYFIINGNNFNGSLRLDPGTIAGKYQIRKISVRKYDSIFK